MSSNRIRVLLVSMLAVFAVSAVAADGAQAVTEGPFYKVAGKRLGAGKKEEIKVKQNGNQVLKVGATTVTCTALKAKEGAEGFIEGSTIGNGDKSEESLEYSGCNVTGMGTCTKTTGGLVTTKLLEGIEGYGGKSAVPEGTGKLLTLFKPKTGTEFAELTFEPAGCSGAAKVKTKAGCTPACEGIIGQDINGSGEELEVGLHETEALSGEVSFPASVGVIWTESGSVLTSRGSGLEAFGAAATYTGKAVITLKNGKNWGVFTKDPKVKVEPNPLGFKELNKLEKEELTLTYTNEGPGGWEPTEFIFTKLEGELGAWGVKLGGIPCNKVIAVGKTCEEIVTFEPKVAAAGKIKADLTTNPASETVVVEGKGK